MRRVGFFFRHLGPPGGRFRIDRDAFSGSGFVDGFSAKVDPLGVGIGNELRKLGPVEHALTLRMQTARAAWHGLDLKQKNFFLEEEGFSLLGGGGE